MARQKVTCVYIYVASARQPDCLSFDRGGERRKKPADFHLLPERSFFIYRGGREVAYVCMEEKEGEAFVINKYDESRVCARGVHWSIGAARNMFIGMKMERRDFVMGDGKYIYIYKCVDSVVLDGRED